MVDVRPASVTRRLRWLVVVILVVATSGAGAWWFMWGQQWRQQIAVEAGMKELSKRQPKIAALLASWPDEDRLRALAKVALDHESFNPIQPALAEAALLLAMRQGSRDAELDLGVLYRDGKLGKADTAKALALFDKVREETEPAARSAEASALIVMGRIYAEGLGVHADQDKAIEMTLHGAASGTPAQKYRVGKDYLRGLGAFKSRANEDEGIRLIEEAARAGNLDAMESAGLYLSVRAARKASEIAGYDTSPDRRQAYEWSAKAAQLGRTSAMSLAGSDAWELGDLGNAEKWLEAAHRGGTDDDPRLLGLIRVMRSKAPISAATPGVDMLVKAYQAAPIANNSKGDERFWNALRAQWEATRGIVIVPAGTSERHRAAITSLAWIYVIGRLRGDMELVSREPLDAHLRSLARQDRLALMAESRTLADIILSSDGAMALGKPASPGARGAGHASDLSSGTPPPAPARRVAQAATGQQSDPFANLTPVPATQRAGEAPAAAKKSSTHRQPPPQTEPPPQDRSGYLRGERRASKQGLSSFTIDNTKGAAGAIVRLYREGQMPADYSFFVKLGESFTGAGVVAGSYVMRYRNLGSGNVYEADKRFDFAEVETSEGTGFTRARVTLFAAPNGNMKTVPVDESKF